MTKCTMPPIIAATNRSSSSIHSTANIQREGTVTIAASAEPRMAMSLTGNLPVLSFDNDWVWHDGYKIVNLQGMVPIVPACLASSGTRRPLASCPQNTHIMQASHITSLTGFLLHVLASIQMCEITSYMQDSICIVASLQLIARSITLLTSQYHASMPHLLWYSKSSSSFSPVQFRFITNAMCPSFPLESLVSIIINAHQSRIPPYG